MCFHDTISVVYGCVFVTRRGAVNSLAPHPHHLPLFAASGLENDAKLFRPGPDIVCTSYTWLDMCFTIITAMCLSADVQ